MEYQASLGYPLGVEALLPCCPWLQPPGIPEESAGIPVHCVIMLNVGRRAATIPDCPVGQEPATEERGTEWANTKFEARGTCPNTGNGHETIAESAPTQTARRLARPAGCPTAEP